MKLIDVPERHLPADFADRLIRSVRRRKRTRQMSVVVFLAAVCVLATCLIGEFCVKDAPRLPTESRLVAAQSLPTNDTRISSLLMFGFFKECFKRSKTGKGKKKDED